MEIVPPLRVKVVPKLLLQPAPSTLGDNKLRKMFCYESGPSPVEMALLSSLADASVGFAVTRFGRG